MRQPKKENDPDQALSKCRLERKRKVADKMRSLRSSNKGINAEPPAKQKSPPGRDEESTESMGVFCGQNFEREYINVLLNKLLLCVIIQIEK